MPRFNSMFKIDLPWFQSGSAPCVQQASWCWRTSWGQNPMRRTFYFGWPVRTTWKLPLRQKRRFLPKGTTQVDAPRQVRLCEWIKSDLYNFTSASIAGLVFVTVTPPEFRLLLLWNALMFIGRLICLCCSVFHIFQCNALTNSVLSVNKHNNVNISPNTNNAWVK